MSPADLRAKAARALDAVRHGHALRDVIEPGAPALLTELAYGACRRHFSIRADVDACLERPLRKADQDVYALLMVGVYQLRHTDIPVHAAVSETVAAALALRKPWARPLINAVLRRIARSPQPGTGTQALTQKEASAISPSPRAYFDANRPARTADEATQDHPRWLIDALRVAYPDACPALFGINNSRAPMALRVNRTKTSVGRYRTLLDAAGVSHREGMTPDCVVLERPMPARKLPGFERGWVAVQDEGAQLAAGLLDPQPGTAVLDACAAPGGKTFHLLERRPSLKLTALDQNGTRLQSLRREARRLGHAPLRVVAGDATRTAWWDSGLFDAILLDVPCSGTGTLRRHPDIKINRRPDGLRRTVQRQRALLAGVWPTLSCGGTLLYCTCSILPAENQDVVAGFLEQTPDAKARTIRGNWGRDADPGRLLLPRKDGQDGFFFALIDKVGDKIGAQVGKKPGDKAGTA